MWNVVALYHLAFAHRNHVTEIRLMLTDDLSGSYFVAVSVRITFLQYEKDLLLAAFGRAVRAHTHAHTVYSVMINDNLFSVVFRVV